MDYNEKIINQNFLYKENFNAFFYFFSFDGGLFFNFYLDIIIT